MKAVRNLLPSQCLDPSTACLPSNLNHKFHFPEEKDQPHQREYLEKKPNNYNLILFHAFALISLQNQCHRSGGRGMERLRAIL